MRSTPAPAVQAMTAFAKLSIATVAAIAVAFVITSYASAATPTATGTVAAPAPAGTAAATLVKTERRVPARRKVRRVRFTPWARPSPRRVRRIIRLEARRWRVSAAGLSRRIACESRYQWAAGNGMYRGLLQFAPSTFYRGMRTIRTRSVKLVRKRSRRVRVIVVKHYSDGRVVRSKGRQRRQVLIRVTRGRIPRNPPMTHGWAQVRIGAQAMRGVSAVASSEWACPA